MDPRRILRRARRGRSRAEKFDAFSDVYIWVLVIGFGLAYAFGFLRAGLGVLLGEFARPVPLPSALLPLADVLLPGAVLIPVLVLRLLLHLGPAAVNGAQSLWWLPLPIDQSGLRRGALRRARAVGALSSSLAWILWFSLTAVLLPPTGWLMLGTGLLTSLCAGSVLADVAVLIQRRTAVAQARRWTKALLWSMAALWLGLWATRSAGLFDADGGALALKVWRPETFLAGFAALLLVLSFTRRSAGRAVKELAPKALRAAGERQDTIRAALFVMNTSVLGQRSQRGGPKSHARRRGTGRWPVAVDIVCKTMLRGGGHTRLLVGLLVGAALLLTVQDAANPMTLGLLLLVLLAQLMMGACAAFEPLLGNSTLGRMLGLGPRQVAGALAYTVLLPSLLLAGGAAAAGLLLFGNAGIWTLPVAVLLAGIGTVAGVSQRCARGQRDLADQLLGIGTTAGALQMVSFLASGMLPLVVGAAPLLLLLGAIHVPWLVWVVAVLAAGPGLKVLVPGR